MFGNKKNDKTWMAEWAEALKEEAREVLQAAGFPNPTAEECIALLAVWQSAK